MKLQFESIKPLSIENRQDLSTVCFLDMCLDSYSTLKPVSTVEKIF